MQALSAALQHYIHTLLQRGRAVLDSVEAWYFDDSVWDLIEPADANDAGGRA